MSVFSPSVRMWVRMRETRGKLSRCRNITHISTFAAQRLWFSGGKKQNTKKKTHLLLLICLSAEQQLSSPPGLFSSDSYSVMHTIQRGPWPTCAGRLNIRVLWAGMTLCHGWCPTCGSGRVYSTAESFSFSLNSHALGQDRLTLTQTMTESQQC